jgi:hypothetical protein
MALVASRASTSVLVYCDLNARERAKHGITTFLTVASGTVSCRCQMIVPCNIGCVTSGTRDMKLIALREQSCGY